MMILLFGSSHTLTTHTHSQHTQHTHLTHGSRWLVGDGFWLVFGLTVTWWKSQGRALVIDCDYSFTHVQNWLRQLVLGSSTSPRSDRVSRIDHVDSHDVVVVVKFLVNARVIFAPSLTTMIWSSHHITGTQCFFWNRLTNTSSPRGLGTIVRNPLSVSSW